LTGLFRFSKLAAEDLLGIAAYTVRTWGEEQATRYLDEIEACCNRLASGPAPGRRCDDIRQGLYRWELAKHVIFFRRVPEGILVSRILHQRMLPHRWLFDDDTDVD